MREEQFTGAIVGLAVGDALGYPAEFRRRAQLLRELGPEGITAFVALKDHRFSRPMILGPDHPPGTYTDDTQMSIAVARGLLAAGDGSLDDLMEEIGRHFVRWSRLPDNNRAPGETCMTGCRNLEHGSPWRDAGVAHSKGCGSAMRVTPIGLYYEDLGQVAEVARASSLLTHGHDAAVEGAAAAAVLVALALRGASPEEMFAEVGRRCCPGSVDFAACWARLPGMLVTPPEVALAEGGLGEAWVAEEAVASALYCVWRHPDDFRVALLEAVNTDGDSDSIGAIAGAVLGARLGLAAIPAEWVARVEDTEQLQHLGSWLWQARTARSSGAP